MRNALVREVTDTTDLVVPAHLPGLAHGRIVTFGDRRRFVTV
jgi:hypothetical protein